MRILFLFLLSFNTFNVFSQKAQQAAETLYKKYPQEKVVLSFSKNEYLAGETIHFKAYVLTGYEQSTISTNLYTELYDKNKTLLDKQILPILHGSTEGSFSIPSNLAEDVYYIRAYTHWMLNFAERFQYLKALRIHNPYAAKALRSKPVNWTAKAVTEGGQLIENVPARVAVRLLSDGSLPASWSGKLLEKETGTLISDITVFNNEVGEVRFLPQANKSYALHLKDDKGTTTEVLLASPKANGVAFNLSAFAGRINYTLAFKNIPKNGTGYKLLGTIHEQVVFSSTIKKSSGQIKATIPADSFPAGVLRLTLFDEKENVVAERLCFLHQESLQKETPVLFTDTFSLQPRERNAWHLLVDSSNYLSYSVQVNDGTYAPDNNFLSDVYLTSDFTTPIRQAHWYLDSVTTEKKAALDALLTAENWERFTWANVLQDNFPVIDHKPDQYLSYSGTVAGGRHIKPLRELNLIFQSQDSSIQFTQVRTDSSGTFLINEMIFTDSMKVYYQPTKRGLFESEIKIVFTPENRFYPLKRDLPPSIWFLEERKKTDPVPWVVQKSLLQINNEKLAGEKARMMQEVIVRTKARTATEELDKKLSSSLFSTPNATVFDFVNDDQNSLLGNTNILSWLQGRVPGYAVRNAGGVLQPLIRNQIAQVFIDEIPVEAGFLNSLSINDIAMIKVIKGNFVGSSSEGSIAIYTRRGDTNGKNKIPILPTGLLFGYRKPIPLFSPDYSVSANNDMPDDRLILSREIIPQLVNYKVRLSVSFYNNTSAKNYHVRVTGFTKDGLPVYLSKTLH